MNDEIVSIRPTEIVGGCISIYRNIWKDPNETINSIENFAQQEHPYAHFESAGLLTKPEEHEENPRTNSHMGLSVAAKVNYDMRKLTQRYSNLVYSAALGYAEHFHISEPVILNEHFNILKYQTGQEYKAHYDGGTASGRSISPILYLNDDYEGGEIEFVNFGIKIKPEPGMLVIFPASYPYAHIAHPVKSGTKYAIVTWLHDREYDQIAEKTLGQNAHI